MSGTDPGYEVVELSKDLLFCRIIGDLDIDSLKEAMKLLSVMAEKSSSSRIHLVIDIVAIGKFVTNITEIAQTMNPLRDLNKNGTTIIYGRPNTILESVMLFAVKIGAVNQPAKYVTSIQDLEVSTAKLFLKEEVLELLLEQFSK